MVKIFAQWVREHADGCEMYFVHVDDGREKYRLAVDRLPNGYCAIQDMKNSSPRVWDLIPDEIERCRAAAYADLE